MPLEPGLSPEEGLALRRTFERTWELNKDVQLPEGMTLKDLIDEGRP
jgi:hypothetical protein